MAQKLSPTQQKLLTSAQNTPPIVFADGSTREPSILVSGHEYRTAIALENKGLGKVRYQGPGMGWFTANEEAPAPTPIKCDMTAECATPATYLGAKGYTYCAAHRDYRRGVEATRPLKRWEIERIQSGKTLLGWNTTQAQTLASESN